MSCNAKKDPNGTWRIQYRWTGTKKKSQKRGFRTKKEEEWYVHFMLQQSSELTITRLTSGRFIRQIWKSAYEKLP